MCVRDEERLAEFTWFSCLQLFQDNPIGDWDGVIDGKLLCNFASLEHTRLVPICDVMPGESRRICNKTSSVVSEHIELSLSRTSSERSEFVFCSQREQRAFCVDVSLVFRKSREILGLFVLHVGILNVYMCD